MQYRDPMHRWQRLLMVTGFIGIALIIILTGYYMYKAYEENTYEMEFPDKVTKTALYEGIKYKEFVNKEGITFSQVGDNEPKRVLMSSNYEKTAEVLNLDTSKVIERYEMTNSNPSLIDPLSIGMKTDIPNTYTATPEMSQGYIGSMLADLEWNTIASFCDTTYCDYYLTRKEENIRIVVSNSSFKILEGIEGIHQTVNDFFTK